MAARKTGRFLAPIALLAVVAMIVLLVRSHLEHHTHHPAAKNQIPGQLVQTTRGKIGHRRPPPKFYIVKSGDTLSAISVKTHVPIATLQILNPSLDPNALQTGQRLRLRR